MINKAFDIVTKKVSDVLLSQNFTKQKVKGESEDELVVLFTGESTAYSIIYYIDKMHMVLRECSMTDDGPDNEWKTNATWMFNPETDTEKQAESIGNDFAEVVTSPIALKKARQPRRKKGKDEGNVDPIFLSKRFITYFPELREEIKEEEDNYYPFRGVTFTQEKIMPKLTKYLDSANKKEINKITQLLSTQYQNGDMDTRSIITMVILNKIDEKHHEALKENMSDELKSAWEFAYKFKDKEVKPAKRKDKKNYQAERL